jgi:hypothetical protein
MYERLFCEMCQIRIAVRQEMYACRSRSPHRGVLARSTLATPMDAWRHHQRGRFNVPYPHRPQGPVRVSTRPASGITPNHKTASSTEDPPHCGRRQRRFAHSRPDPRLHAQGRYHIQSKWSNRSAQRAQARPEDNANCVRVGRPSPNIGSNLASPPRTKLYRAPNTRTLTRILEKDRI